LIIGPHSFFNFDKNKNLNSKRKSSLPPLTTPHYSYRR
jgi:hypothetical protein